MQTTVVILLAVIVYFLWKIYRQREVEKEEIVNEKLDVKFEQGQKEKFKDYPHLYGKLEGSWLDVFASQFEKGLPLLKVAFLLMIQESTKIDFSEGSLKYDMLWPVSEELLEHLEKFHEGSIAEHEIAVTTYWQIAATKVGELIKNKPNTESLSSGAHTAEIEGKEIETEPFTNIDKIASLFPKKANHPAKEITFFDEKGSFPRESKGSAIIKEKLSKLGL